MELFYKMKEKIRPRNIILTGIGSATLYIIIAVLKLPETRAEYLIYAEMNPGLIIILDILDIYALAALTTGTLYWTYLKVKMYYE